MKEIRICDVTLSRFAKVYGREMTFKEKLEISHFLDRLAVSVIDLGEIVSPGADSLMIKSVANDAETSRVCVGSSCDKESIDRVWAAVKGAKKPRIRITVPVSVSRMEYVLHQKGEKVLAAIYEGVSYARTLCDDVECALDDATRADRQFLYRAAGEAVRAGAACLTLCDTAGLTLPEEMAALITDVKENVPETNERVIAVDVKSDLCLAESCALAAVRAGAGEIKVSCVALDTASLEGIVDIIAKRGEEMGFACRMNTTEIKRVLGEIRKRAENGKRETTPFENGVRDSAGDERFDEKTTAEELYRCIRRLGYDLSGDDEQRVWNAFSRIVSRKKSLDVKEIEVIVAAEAVRVPKTYTLENYVVTTGNAMDIMAHIKLRYEGEVLNGLSIGDGPIDAAFLAIEKITGRHFELDDFQLQSISEGREAMGQTFVKLRSNGKVYSGRGLSTDIIGSGIEAYVNALNKIVYEEENR